MTTPLPTPTREKLREMLSKATPAHVTPSHSHERDDPLVIVWHANKVGMDIAHFRGPDRVANADFYIAARNALPSLLDAIDAADKEIERLRGALQPLVNIADRYDDNGLDDEARKFWGKDDEHQNKTDPKLIELYLGRGGSQLLTLADCLNARAALTKDTAP